MILTDTKLQLVSFSQEVEPVKFKRQLSLFCGQIDIVDHISSHTNKSNCPIIWLLFFDSAQQIEETPFRKYHNNNEAFIFVVKDTAKKLNSLFSFPMLSIRCGEAELQETLLIEEQRILQRNLFQSADINDELFLQLNFYGRSSAYVETMKMIQQVANTEATVFIKGETGTGKELAARSIHYLSNRKSAPFIPINCGAFNDDLILSELFGYEKGAFTGATKSKEGLLEIANNGTVFLDEIDSLSPKAQVAMLRYLQDNEIRPVGGHQIKKVNVRVVAASNQDIKQLIKQGDFREDLLYRLDVLTINLPPLSVREEDIQLLAQYFLAKVALENNAAKKVFSADVINAMQDYSWPGNVRELENFVTRAFLLTQEKVINNTKLLTGTPVSFLSPRSKISLKKTYSKSFNDEKQGLIKDFEREYLDQILYKTQGNISKAASLANKERRSFCRLMKKHGLERKHYLRS